MNKVIDRFDKQISNKVRYFLDLKYKNKIVQTNKVIFPIIELLVEDHHLQNIFKQLIKSQIINLAKKKEDRKLNKQQEDQKVKETIRKYLGKLIRRQYETIKKQIYYIELSEEDNQSYRQQEFQISTQKSITIQDSPVMELKKIIQLQEQQQNQNLQQKRVIRQNQQLVIHEDNQQIIHEDNQQIIQEAKQQIIQENKQQIIHKYKQQIIHVDDQSVNQVLQERSASEQSLIVKWKIVQKYQTKIVSDFGTDLLNIKQKQKQKQKKNIFALVSHQYYKKSLSIQSAYKANTIEPSIVTKRQIKTAQFAQTQIFGHMVYGDRIKAIKDLYIISKDPYSSVYLVEWQTRKNGIIPESSMISFRDMKYYSQQKVMEYLKKRSYNMQ